MPVPPKAARDNAKRVLDWRDKYPDEIKGMTRTGWARANQIAKGENLSDDTVSRIAAFERHRKNSEIAEEFKGTPWKDAGYVAWLGWGGDAGIAWAQKEVSKRENNSGQQVEGNEMSQIRVNVRTLVNNSAIREEVRNGRKVMIIPSATLPDNVIMNGGLYPADEIAKSFHTLEGTLAPMGHPMVNGTYVSAMHPQALTGEYQPFAVNENVMRKDGRVYLNKVVDIQNAEVSEKGKRLLEAVANGDQIHTSTGVLLEREESEGDGYEWIARNMSFDHDAILLDQAGAATPDQGVGMMVNSEGEELEVVNVDLPDDMLENMAEYIAEEVHYAEMRAKKKGLAGKLLDALRSVLQSEQATGLQLTSNSKESEDMTPEQLKEVMDAISAQKAPVVNAEDTAKAVAEAVTGAMKPLVDAVNGLQAEKVAAAEAEKAALVDTVVNANVLDKVTAESMTVNQLKPLAEKFGKPGSAAPVAGHFTGNSDNQFAEMPE